MSTNTNYAELYYNDISKDWETLEKNVQDYPASSVARFMLLYHLKKNNDPGFDELAKQTGVYLQNPLWMDFQLSDLQHAETEESDKLAEDNENQQLVIDDEIKIEGQNAISPANEETTEYLPSKSESSEIASEEVNETKTEALPENQPEVTEYEIPEELPDAVNEERTENFLSKTSPEETASEETVNEPNAESIPENEIIEQHNEKEELPVVVNEQINEDLPAEIDAAEAQNEQLVEKTNEDAILNNEIVEVPDVKEAEHDSELIENIPEPQLQDDKNEPAFSNETVGGETTGEELRKEGEDEDVAVPFEPLHTVDYFASQGIQLSEEALQNDQLGKQVKSFTAWLKSMKKLHPGQLPEQNEVIEKLIQTSSEVSNQNANVLTEAMAEVLVKQGKREKALEMYEKLSLLNPSKSAYFAAKIESLKTV